MDEERKKQRERNRKAILRWIRDDLGITAKMGIYPTEVEKLLDRLEGAENDEPDGRETLCP